MGSRPVLEGGEGLRDEVRGWLGTPLARLPLVLSGLGVRVTSAVEPSTVTRVSSEGRAGGPGRGRAPAWKEGTQKSWGVRLLGKHRHAFLGTPLDF